MKCGGVSATCFSQLRGRCEFGHFPFGTTGQHTIPIGLISREMRSFNKSTHLESRGRPGIRARGLSIISLNSGCAICFRFDVSNSCGCMRVGSLHLWRTRIGADSPNNCCNFNLLTRVHFSPTKRTTASFWSTSGQQKSACSRSAPSCAQMGNERSESSRQKIH